MLALGAIPVLGEGGLCLPSRRGGDPGPAEANPAIVGRPLVRYPEKTDLILLT